MGELTTFAEESTSFINYTDTIVQINQDINNIGILIIVGIGLIVGVLLGNQLFKFFT